MRRVFLFVLAVGVAAVPPAATDVSDVQRPGARARDANQRAANRRADDAARRVFDQVARDPALAASLRGTSEAPGDLCAIAVIPGPATGFDIRFGIFNVVAEDLEFSTIDSFLALDHNALIHESVFGASAPALGTLSVEYPDGVAGKGPVVLSFKGFGLFDSASFNTDPDTYDNPAFGATVEDMDDTVLELAYDGGRRCRGSLTFVGALNASVALITQTSP